MRTRLLLLVLACTLVAGVLPRSAAGAGWLTEAMPVAPAQGGTVFGSPPALGVHPSGRTWAAWGANGSAWVASRLPGAAFAAPVELAAPSGERSVLFAPALLAPADGRVVVVWREISSADERCTIGAAEQSPDGAWPPVDAPFVGDGGTGRSCPLPALAELGDGSVVVAYERSGSVLASRRPPGDDFGPPSAVASVRSQGTPAIGATGAKGAVLAWSDFVDHPPAEGACTARSEASLRASHLGDDGGWSAPRTIEEGTVVSDCGEEPRARLDEVQATGLPDGSWAVGWQDHRTVGDPILGEGTQAIRVATGPGPGSSHRTNTLSTGPYSFEWGPAGLGPLLVTDRAGGLTAGWALHDAETGRTRFYAAHRAAGADFPPDPQFRTEEDAEAYSGARLGLVRVDGRSLALVRGSGTTLAASRLTDGRLDATVDLGAGLALLDVADDGAGTAVILGERPDRRLDLRVHDGSVPALGAPQAPSGAVTGVPAEFAASATDAWSTTTIRWDFGDGASATGERVRHAFAAPGRYTVRATAVDGADNATTRDVTVTVEPAPSSGAADPEPDGRPPEPDGRPLVPDPEPPLGPRAVTPRVRALRVTPARLRIGSTRVTIKAVVSHPGTVRFAIRRRLALRSRSGCRTARARRRSRCARFVTRGTLQATATGKRVRRRWSGRVRGRPLAPGRYRVSATLTTAAGATSGAVSVPVTILRAR